MLSHQTLAALLLVLLGTSCATSKQWLKAKPAKHLCYLKSSPDMRPDAPGVSPFHYSARTMSVKALKKDLASKCIWIAPVDLHHLRPTSKALMAAQESNGLHRPAAEIAASLRQAFANAFASNSNARYRVVSKPVEGCVELRLALVEFDQTNAAGNIVKTVAGKFVGPLAMFAGPFVKGTIAIEGRLLIHGSEELLYEFADRESDPVTVVSVRSYNGTGFAVRSIEKWASQFEQMTRMYQVDGRVLDANVLRLNPF